MAVKESRWTNVPILSSPWWRDPVALLIILALCPLFLGDYELQSLGSFMPYAMASAALALVWGYCGILALGQAVFFGVGAYACARVLQSMSLAPGLVIGLLLGAVLAGGIAWLLARAAFGLRADVFLISVMTFCLAVATEQLALKFTSITGGQNGIALDRLLPQEALPKYLIATSVFAVTLLLLVLISRSDWGRVVAATRDNDRRLRYFGTDVDVIKRRVFVLGAVVTSFAGALDAVYSRIAAPDKIGFGLSTFILLWCALGGRRSITSAALGALLVNYVANQLSGVLVNYWQVVLAVLFIVVVMYFPDGLYWPIRVLGQRFNFRTPMTLIPALMTTAPKLDEPAFVARDLKQTYGDFIALNLTEVAFDSGVVTALIGPNGAGKTTLINVASGGSRSATGSALMLGHEIIRMGSTKVARLDVKRKFQNPSIFNSLSVQDNLVIGRALPLPFPRAYVSRAQSLSLPEDVLRLATEHDLIDHLMETSGDLSHGSKQFLEVCMVLSSEPRVILLDEPTAGMTVDERARIGSLVRSLAKAGAAVLIIEHDFDFVRNVSDRILVMNQGELIASGTVEEVSANRQVRQLYLGVPS